MVPPVTWYQIYVGFLPTSSAVPQVQIVLITCVQGMAGVIAFMSILNHLNLGRDVVVKRHLLTAQLFIVIFAMTMSAVNLVETFYYKNIYLTVISVFSFVLMEYSVVITYITMLKRSLILGRKTSYMPILVVLYVTVIGSTGMLYDILIVTSYFSMSSHASRWIVDRLLPIFDGIALLSHLLIFAVNCVGNHLLFSYYYRQRTISERRNRFVGRIADRRLRLVLFATFIESTDIVLFVCLLVGCLWVPEISMSVLAVTVQCELLLLFIDEDLEVTALTSTIHSTSTTG